MNDLGKRYVVDTNALSQLGQSRRSSPLFRENARIPTDVLDEAQGFPDHETLRQLEYATTAGVLRRVVSVMATVSSGDTSLVDLYANRGKADPFVVACALDGQYEDSQYLDGADWVVVTGDKAVRAKATAFGLAVLTTPEFAALLDAAVNDSRAN